MRRLTPRRLAALQERVESYAVDYPIRYRWKVRLLGWFGRAYILFLMLLPVAAIAGLVVAFLLTRGPSSATPVLPFLLKAGVPVALFLLVMLRVLWVRFPPPTGTELRRSDAGRLFGIADDVRKRTHAPRTDQILLTDGMAYSVTRVPRFGLFGGNRTVLSVGISLMHAVSQDELKNLLGLHFLPYSVAYATFEQRVLRRRKRLSLLLDALERAVHPLAFVLRGFYSRFVPWYLAYTTPLARAAAIEACGQVSQMFGTRIGAQALSTVAVKERFLRETYWPELLARAQVEPVPAHLPYRDMVDAFARRIGEGQATAWLERALREPSPAGSPEPGLAQCLEAIGQPHEPPRQLVQTASGYFMGRNQQRLTDAMDKAWLQTAQHGWTLRHQDGLARKAELAQIRASALHQPLQPGIALRQALLTEALEGPAAARPFYEALAARGSPDPLVAFRLGRLLLDAGDAGGLAFLEGPARTDGPNALEASQRIAAFLCGTGRAADASPWLDRAAGLAAEQARARDERSSVAPRDALEPHGLEPVAVDRIAEVVDQERHVKQAWLARRQVSILPDQPLYVIGIRMRFWHRRDRKSAPVVAALQRRLAFAGDVRVIALHGARARLRRVMRRFEGAELIGD